MQLPQVKEYLLTMSVLKHEARQLADTNDPQAIRLARVAIAKMLRRENEVLRLVCALCSVTVRKEMMKVSQASFRHVRRPRASCRISLLVAKGQ